MDSELFRVLFTMQKLNILIFGLNRLGMKNFVGFLNKGQGAYRYVEVQHALVIMALKRSIEGYRSLLPLKFSGVKCIHI